MSDARRQRIEALRKNLSAEQRALLEQRLAAGARGGAAAAAEAVAVVEARPRARSQVGFQDVVSAGAATAADALPDHVISLELAGARSDDAHALSLICRVLDRLGYRVGDACSNDDLLTRVQSRPLYAKLVSRWLIELELAGVVDRRSDNGGLLTARYSERLEDRPPGAPPPYWPQTPDEIIDVLRGKMHPLELMERAGGIFETVTGYHRDTPRSRYYNSVVATLISRYAAALDARPVRVLEVGAGVGGTTGSVLDALPAERTTYFFTDISSAFFEFARAQLGSRPTVVYRVFDINDEASKHGLADAELDVVLASNAIHCARNLGSTLRSIRRLLVEGGLLVLRELTVPRAAHILMPGLMPGFSDFSDERILASSPLLSKEAWCRLLHDTSYESATVLPDGGPCDLLGEHVIVARKPGVEPAPTP